MRHVLLATTAAALTLGAPTARAEQPEELGVVKWERDFARGLATAKRTGRPALVLFDEVPGCQTVRNYGDQVLSHPLIVEAAETAFVPVAVYNNIGGADRVVLESFGEPTWNNPVVRIIGADKRPLAPRVNGDYTAPGLARAMVTALDAAGREAPEYLRVLAAEHPRAKRETATFSMYCFWSGEVAIGSVDGVVSTTPGFLDGREVVEATFDPRVVSFEKLLSSAKAAGQADRVYARSDAQLSVAKEVTRAEASGDRTRRSAKDDKYQLRHTAYRFVPMTPGQATKVNAALGRRQDPSRYLSAGQRAIYAAARANPKAQWRVEVGNDDLIGAYARAAKVAADTRSHAAR